MTRTLRETAMDRGADLFGVADADCFLSEDYLGNRPQTIMPAVRSVVVIGVAVPKGCLAHLPQGRAEYTNTLMAGTAMLRLIAFALARRIDREGYLATIAPTEGNEFGYWYADRSTLKADLSIKYAAYCAGLGRFGRHHLLITDAFGPRVRMTAILTDAPLEADRPRSRNLVHAHCAECRICTEICPAGALLPDGSIDRQRCAEYMFTTLGGLRCGLCVKTCPL
jgi:epoxyqueuosine reductase QueG